MAEPLKGSALQLNSITAYAIRYQCLTAKWVRFVIFAYWVALFSGFPHCSFLRVAGRVRRPECIRDYQRNDGVLVGELFATNKAARRVRRLPGGKSIVWKQSRE
jgi:hypothetical protein